MHCSSVIAGLLHFLSLSLSVYNQGNRIKFLVV